MLALHGATGSGDSMLRGTRPSGDAHGVVVLSPRPGRITDVIHVDLPHPRTFETREEPRFFELVTQVRESLHGGSRRRDDSRLAEVVEER